MAGGPIRSHSTDTSTKAWAGSRMETKLGGAPAKVLKKAYAWVDPDGDPDVKGSYKFIHHEVASKRARVASGFSTAPAVGLTFPAPTARASTTTWPGTSVTQGMSRPISNELSSDRGERRRTPPRTAPSARQHHPFERRRAQVSGEGPHWPSFVPSLGPWPGSVRGAPLCR